MEEAPAAASEIIRISEDGDVIFSFPQATPGEHSKVLVSSVILKMASPVFKTLLGPHFREGQNARSSSNPFEIPLREDDPRATADLCRLLHHTSVPDLDFGADMERMVACAVAVDKWDCTQALQRSFRGIMLQALYGNTKNSDYKKLGQLAAIAYCLGEQQVFGAVFDKLMLHLETPTSYLRAILGKAGRILPAQFYFVLEETRNKAREALSTGVRRLASSCKLCRRSRAKPVMDTEYLRHIAMNEPMEPDFMQHVGMDKLAATWPPAWELDDVSLEKALSHVRGLARYTCEFQDECRFCGQQSPVCVERADFEQLVRDTTELWEHLSLACIKQECVPSYEASSLYCDDHPPEGS